MNLFKQKVIKNFDAGAFYYDDYADIQQQIAIDLCDKIKGTPNTILEIGCGTGFLTTQLRKKFPKAQITATDIAPNMVAKCQQKFTDDKDIKFSVMDGENIQTDKKFDLIISSMTFQWFEKLSEALKGLKSTLTKEGEVYYSLPNPQSFPEWRAILAKNNFDSGFIIRPCGSPAIDSKTYVKQYKNAVDFLHHIKKIGAQTTNEDYKNLNPMQLRKICQQFDKGNRDISWVIDYYNL